MDEYDALLAGTRAVKFGTRNVRLGFELIPGILTVIEGERLFLESIREFHRTYRRVS